MDSYGPISINFANILKYEYIPLAKTINVILDVVKEALGSPVEIEFAVDLTKDKAGLASFYLLQIKPLVCNEEDYNVDVDKIDQDHLVLYSEKTITDLFSNIPSTTDIKAKLIKKDKQGVEIRIIYDYLGSRSFNNSFLKVLRLHGILVHPIDKLIVPIFNTKVNYRYHRKITIIDGKFAFTGGFNIGNEYLFGTRKYNWRDTHMEIEGAIIQSLTALFSRDWYYVTNELITNKKYYPIQTVEEEGIFQLLQSGPDTIPIIRNTYLKLIYAAKKYIYISTPYLGLDKEYETALKMAARAGNDVKILIPGRPDKLMIYKVTESFILPLLESGIKIYKYKHTFNHSKFIVVDDEIGSCGTYNFDVRSALINFENTILMYNRSVSVLKEEFLVDLKKSEEITLMAWGKRSKVNSFITDLFTLITQLTSER